MAARLWVLNLDAEYELADPRGYRPSPATQARMRALSGQLSGLLGPDDRVLDDRVLDDRMSLSPEGFEGRCWCPTPRALARLQAVGVEPPSAPALAVLQRVCDRRFKVELDSGPLQSGYADERTQALALLAAASPTAPRVAKRAFSFAGRGQRRFFGPATAEDVRWLDRSFGLGHGLLIERWVQRQADFSLHGWVTAGLATRGVVTLGRPLQQLCNAHGQWLRTVVAPRDVLSPGGEDEVALRERGMQAGQALHAAGYFGPFGIDAFRYLINGSLRFNPLSEINARYTMGFGLSGLTAMA